MTIDAAGNIYIADQGNNKVRVVSTDGMISTFAGTATFALGDGGPADRRTVERAGFGGVRCGRQRIYRRYRP